MSRSTLASVLLALAGFLLLWTVVVVVSGFPPFILPPPWQVAERWAMALAAGTIQPHLWTTLSEVALGFAVGAGSALVAGYALARSALVERLLSPYLVALQATPILAIATMVGIRSVDVRLLELGRSLRATRRQVLLTLEVPAALPSILGGMRVGVTLAVVGAIVGEWAGAERGLGVLVNLARGSLFDIPLMFATLLTIALVGIALYVVVVIIERRLVGAR
jgi:NitT/TauT family transport system permease protein